MICQYKHHEEFEKEIKCEKCGGDLTCGPFMHGCEKCDPELFKPCGCRAMIIFCCC
jgi:hypothetical protein